MESILDFAHKYLADLEASNLRRKLTKIKWIGGQRAVVDGRKVVVFSTNDYLGLARHPKVKQGAAKAARLYGNGSTGSRLLTGGHPLLFELEERLSLFKNVEATIVIGSGYLANIAVLQALGGEDCTVFSDRLNHASIIDGCKLSRCKLVIYPHCDLDSLEWHLKHTRNRKVIVTDAVFSMDGDVVDVPSLIKIAHAHGAILVLDDAHGTGVMGPGGRGTLAYYGISPPSFVIQVGTLSKALGSYGAFVCGARDIIELIINRGRPLVFSTALPPSIIGGAIAALEILQEQPDLVKKLHQRADELRSRLKLPTSAHSTISLVLGEAKRAVAASMLLYQMGFLVQAIRPPTVPEGTSRLRINVAANHSRTDIKKLANAIITVLEQVR